MRRWFTRMAVWALASAQAFAGETWVESELKEAERQAEKRQFALAHALYRNLLAAHLIAPLNATALEQARAGLAASASRLQAEQRQIANPLFVERATRLGYVKVGPAWMPTQAKERLAADALARAERLTHGKACPACKGQGINSCPNCNEGIVRCIGCLGTGRTGGSPITSRGSSCLSCDGRGKVKCLLCKGTGCGVCPKCEGVGVVE